MYGQIDPTAAAFTADTAPTDIGGQHAAGLCFGGPGPTPSPRYASRSSTRRHHRATDNDGVDGASERTKINHENRHRL